MKFLSQIFDFMFAPAGTFDPASAVHDAAADRSVNAHSSATDISATNSLMTRFSQRDELVCEKAPPIAFASAADSHLDTKRALNPATSMTNKNKGVA